jgi:hypothetical protein
MERDVVKTMNNLIKILSNVDYRLKNKNFYYFLKLD